MRYLIYVIFDGEAFFTNWFGGELIPGKPVVCFDLDYEKFTIDGKEWKDINEDHL